MDPQAKLDELHFNVARSIRYHDKRRGFFELFGKLLQFIALISSSVAVIALLDKIDKTHAALILSSIAAAATLCNLVVGSSAKLEQHTKLKNRFIDLLSKIEATGSATEVAVRTLIDERLQIEKEEPAISHWLNTLCYNETVDALGYDASAKRQAPWYYYLGNLKLS